MNTKIDIGKAFKDALDIFKQNAVLLIVTMLIAQLVGSATFSICTGGLTIAFFAICLRLIDGDAKTPEIGDIFKGFSVKTEELFHFQLYRQAMVIPAGFARHHLSLHGVVARNHIFDDPGQDMAYMRLSVRGRRSVEEHIGRAAFAVPDALAENIIFLPELPYAVLPFPEAQVCVYSFVHT